MNLTAKMVDEMLKRILDKRALPGAHDFAGLLRREIKPLLQDEPELVTSNVRTEGVPLADLASPEPPTG